MKSSTNTVILSEIRESDTSVTNSKLPLRSPATMPPTKPSVTQLGLDNIVEGETVYQRCVLVSGHCQVSENDGDFIAISSPSFPTQTWPVTSGRFKALLILSPGPNELHIQHKPSQTTTGQKRKHVADEEELNLTLTYIPLLQTPPLHLAIMIAKDSPLLIDCPPCKRGGLTSAHSDLDAAIKKFRMTAYMWQALTAEDMRSKGLGRRSFRLEEEWTADTLSSTFVNSSFDQSNVGLKSSVRSTAKIHLIRSDKTVAQLRDAQVAQQNSCAGERRKQDLHKWFTDALKAAGGPFASSAKPIVAGLILDSHYDIEQDLITAHAALGNSNPKGISLGMMGSHLTYSWPRFLEEVTACLTDTSVPGQTVGNDNGECGTVWEACAIGQGAFLHEVGHAFGADHTESPTGNMNMGNGKQYPIGNIMQRGYAQHWPKNFLSHTAYCSAKNADGCTVKDGHGDGKMVNPARWELKDALAFHIQDHFWMPGDKVLDNAVRNSMPTVEVGEEILGEGGDSSYPDEKFEFECAAGIARIWYQVHQNGDGDDNRVSVQDPLTRLEVKRSWIGQARKDQEAIDNSVIRVLGMNGKEKTFHMKKLLKLKNKSQSLPVPGSDIRLEKQSVSSDILEAAPDNQEWWEWAVLFNEMKNGRLTRATKIDTRVGIILDGAIVHFDDGHNVPCGIRHDNRGHPHHYGGHASEAIHIPKGVEVVKLAIGKGRGELLGMRVYLSNGQEAGELNQEGDDDDETEFLEPPPTHKIIGFFGQSSPDGFGQAHEFGIITAPRNIELPPQIYEMKELQNTDGGLGHAVEREDVDVSDGEEDESGTEGRESGDEE